MDINGSLFVWYKCHGMIQLFVFAQKRQWHERVAMLDINHPVERVTRTLIRSKFTVLSSTQMNQWEGQVPKWMQCLNHWYSKPDWKLYEPSSPTFSHTLVEKQII